ncbi:vomeronasal type-1 receptor 4-like [Callospermophilus lateralis]|uniref:vomeronasal type-1 receptor 4-like n=1 Tax=Callospermophilus lateralis TaxID=76772 RepID=UPI004053E640
MSGFRSRPTDLILRHLTVANSLVLLSRGIPEIMAAFGLRRFLGDIGCKLVFSVHRVARGVSVTTTCLLSIFQYITVSPRNSRYQVSSRSTAETRATRSILVLGSAFIFSYTLSSIIHVCFSEFGTTAWWLVSTSALVNGCFPTASPFILMGRERCASHHTWRK